MIMPGVPEDSLPTRHSLLNRLKDWRDDASWHEFFETYWRLIYNVALKSGLTEVEAEEVVQETIIGVAKKIEKFKPGAEHGSFKSWLLQQTYWRITDQFRKRAREAPSGWRHPGGQSSAGPRDEDATATVNRISDPASLELSTMWESEWEEHIMRTALERVKTKAGVKQFQMFDLHALQGLSVTETARVLGTSVAAVYMAASRLRKALKAEVARFGRDCASVGDKTSSSRRR